MYSVDINQYIKIVDFRATVSRSLTQHLNQQNRATIALLVNTFGIVRSVNLVGASFEFLVDCLAIGGFHSST